MKNLLIFFALLLPSCAIPIMDNVAVSKIYQPSLKPVRAGISANAFNYKQVGRWSFQFEIDKVKYRGSVPSGWISDGTSIPQAVWSISGITRDGLERASAWGHDWQYSHVGRVVLEYYNKSAWVHVDRILSREEADNIFYQGLLKSGVDEKRAKLMFDMVRKFGGHVWDRHLK